MAKGKKTWRRWLLLFVVLAVGGGTGWYAYDRQKKTIITVQTEKVIRRNLVETVVATGKIQPVIAVVIAPEVSGEIIELPVKEGQEVKKGDLLVRIKPDNYLAMRNSAEANFKSAQANRSLALANLEKARIEFERVKSLFEGSLVSESQFLESKTSLEVMRASHETTTHQTDMAKASVAKAEEDLAKTSIHAPVPGTVTKLKSQRGERVLGTSMMSGTEIMTIADLSEMEARVDVGEIDVVLIQLGQKTRLEVDSFKDVNFSGEVTEIANAAKGSALGTQQEATKFEVKIRIREKDAFRPGMSVTADIETRYRTNVLAVPIQCVTTRLPKGAAKPDASSKKKSKEEEEEKQEQAGRKKTEKAVKLIEVAFTVQGGKAKMVPVKRGISDDNYTEITAGVVDGMEVVSGGYRAISKDLEDDKPVKMGVEAKSPKGGSETK